MNLMKKAWLIGGIASVLVVAGAGGGYAWWRHAQEAEASDTVTSRTGQVGLDTSSQNKSVPLSAATDTPSIPLGTDDSKKADTGGLKVTTDGSGQTGLGGSATAQANGSSNSSNSSSSSDSSGGLDFKSYEKYKDQTSALFGDIAPGDGAEAVANKRLTIQYRGYLIDGSLFDQSYGKSNGFTFVLGAHSVVVGMEQGLVGMKVGGKRRIVIPPSVGYGDKGQGPVPPGAIMIFDVELLKVE